MNLQSILSELEQVDQEFFDRMAHVSRRGLFNSLTKKTVAAAAPAIMASALTDAYGQSTALPENVVDVLNFALTLEYLEYRFYDNASNFGTIPAALRLPFEKIRQHEQIHVTLLKTVLGSRAVPEPKFDFTAKGAFPTVFSNFETFATIAQAFEDTGVRAYKGQAPNLMNAKPILEVALQIHAVEATHAARVRYLRGQKGWIPLASLSGLPASVGAAVYKNEDNTIQSPATGNVNVYAVAAPFGVSVEGATEAFDEPLTKDEVLAIAAPFLA